MSNSKDNRLQELKRSDYEIEEGQPNIRGWDVLDSNDKEIGDVRDLIFDVESLKVRYIILNLEKNVFDLDKRDVLVPIGLAQLDNDDDDVILPDVTKAQLKALPDYNRDMLDDNYEVLVRNVFVGAGGAVVADTLVSGRGGDVAKEDFYNHDHFNEDNLYRNRTGKGNTSTSNTTTSTTKGNTATANTTTGNTTVPIIEEELQLGKRQVEKGGIRLRTRIVETPVSENINLREEKVSVTRTPVDRPANAADLQAGDIELTERAEVAVVSKEARVVEEISLNKDVTERQETVSDTVRKTEVDVDRTDKDGKITTDISNS